MGVHPNLEELVDGLGGSWTLDKKKSESMDPLLVLQGVNWVKRKIAASLGQTQVINFEKNGEGGDELFTLRIQTVTGPVTTKLEGIVDGPPGALAADGEASGGSATATISVAPCDYPNCKKFMIHVIFNLENGHVRTVTHAITEDGTTKITQMTYEIGEADDRKSASVTRIFTRS